MLRFLIVCGMLWGGTARAGDLWELARSQRHVHRFSTLFTAQDVRDRLSSEQGLAEAIDWAKKTAITKVYLETFRNGYQAERPALLSAKRRFEEAGFDVSGCVTTTRIGKISTGWNLISCYTARSTQDQLQAIFEYTAGLFDEIMIDDFWFTDCACEECETARKARRVRIGEESYPVSGDTWEDYRSELMVQVSRRRVLGAAKRVNPKARLIIKYPQWYDRFHERGYDVARQTADFDLIWVGTETRDRDKKGVPQYEAYFIMRWLGSIGGPKTGGGWYDPLSTTERTYLEQARQTVLAGARESMLFCYGALLRNTGPANIAALRPQIPELLKAAAEVRRRQITGIATYKPPSSHPEKELYVFDYAGMLGLPLAPGHEFPANAPAAFFSIHALKDPEFAAGLTRFIRSRRPVLLTDGLAEGLRGRVNLAAPNVRVLPVSGDPKTLLKLSQEELDRLRAPLLQPFKASFSAPNEVSLCLFKDGSWVVQNFNDAEVTVELNRQRFQVPARGWVQRWR
ncbi:MAG: hypothetical protein AAB225_06110 [Acidobacteriota bacterium]